MANASDAGAVSRLDFNSASGIVTIEAFRRDTIWLGAGPWIVNILLFTTHVRLTWWCIVGPWCRLV